MRLTYWFPYIMIALSLGAAFVYVAEDNMRRAIYWTAAAVTF